METTIGAISTSLGVGAISIIRLSGPAAIEIVARIFDGTNLQKASSHTIHYGHIVDENKKIIDEVLVMIMRSPKSFTTEDIVEINCHGGISCTNKIMEILIKGGCQIAEPGEFTKRAFLNGRIDLIEAEAVSDMIASETDLARDLAINQITGQLSNKIKALRDKIGELLANIEVNIDYPEYNDIEQMTTVALKPKLIAIKKELEILTAETQNGKIIKNGINIALVGRPNVGKSSLLNALVNEEKAIVTKIPGTTRDIVEASFVLQGIKINLIDTAGIRPTKDIIEKIGIKKSLKAIDEADLVLLVLNNSEKLTAEDNKLIKLISSKEKILFINKTDLSTKLELEDLNNMPIIFGNTVTAEGLIELKEKIVSVFNLDKIKQKNPTYLSNSRQIALIKLATNQIEACLDQIELNSPIDILAIDIKSCWDYLGEIIGQTYRDDLIDTIFSKFCLGK